ncbi:unnamed protein product [Phytophthora fragariaefolia]|uniref:Unnamed protein product n=1 Tax=Phytophthora fragariaefolia TaxID=1490495 RepID=A0A9W7D176_9STRA|nr:unnamed protein product [Phytophthora fragariaefolia]
MVVSTFWNPRTKWRSRPRRARITILIRDPDDGMNDEDEDQDEASDDEMLNIAHSTPKRRRLSQSSAEAPTSKKLKAKSLVRKNVNDIVQQVQIGVLIPYKNQVEVRRSQTAELKHRYCSRCQGSPASGHQGVSRH